MCGARWDPLIGPVLFKIFGFQKSALISATLILFLVVGEKEDDVDHREDYFEPISPDRTSIHQESQYSDDGEVEEDQPEEGEDDDDVDVEEEEDEDDDDDDDDDGHTVESIADEEEEEEEEDDEDEEEGEEEEEGDGKLYSLEKKLGVYEILMAVPS